MRFFDISTTPGGLRRVVTFFHDDDSSSEEAESNSCIHPSLANCTYLLSDSSLIDQERIDDDDDDERELELVRFILVKLLVYAAGRPN